MVKGFCSVLVRAQTLVLFLLMALFFAPDAWANSKYAAYVVHADSGDVLFDRYSTQTRYPASLTKMMTLYLLFDELEAGTLTLDSKITISAHAAGQPPSKLGVSSGSSIDVETAINALVVKSANDVAAAVAEKISGSEWRFAQKMTEKARALGMRGTTFRNASGLPNSRQVTTARDMATLGRRLMQDHPAYFHYFAVQSFDWNGRTYRTHNALIRTYQGATGLKTGYTRRSGFNLVTSSDRDGNRLIGVVLGGRSSATRDAHMRLILDNAYAEIAKQPAMIAALHRSTPTPRIKPTLLAELQARGEVPTLAANETMRAEIRAAAAAFEPAAPSGDPAADGIGALIAGADPDDFNEFQRARLAALMPEDGVIGEGDGETLADLGWSIQVGAYSTKEMAQAELEKAVTLVGMADRDRLVLPVATADGGTVFRARVTRLSEIEAATACVVLADKGKSCFAVAGPAVN